MRKPRDITQHLIISSGLKIPRFQFSSEIRVKDFGPIISQCIQPHSTQIVNDIATSHNQHTFFTQWFKFTSQHKVFNRWPGKIERELKRGNIRCREQMHKDRPRTMIQAPLSISRYRSTHKTHHCFRHLRCARSRILLGVQSGRETSKIVDRFRLMTYMR